MDNLKELWAGQIFGTNTGKIFLEFTELGDRLAGTLKVADDQHGLATLLVSGTFKDGLLTLEGEPIDGSPEVESGAISAIGNLQPDGRFLGEWKSAIGTAGTFNLFPHVGARENVQAVGPEQIYTTVKELGALRLFRNDVVDIISSLQRKFPESKVVVTHIDRAAELARFSPEFEKDLDRLDKLTWLKMNVQANVGNGLSKVITIDLGQVFNRITTQGPDESWVLGEAEAISSFLKRREKRLSTALGKYRVNLNQVILLGALIALPDLPLYPRASFAVAVVILIMLATKVQSTLIPNMIVDLSKPRSSWIVQAWPSLLSWIISVTAGVAASLIYALLTDAPN